MLTEFVLPIRTFLMTIACHERIKLELSAQAVWQFPTFSRKEVQLIVHVSRSLSDQFFRVGRSVVVLNLQHITAIFHSDVCSQLAHDCDWCQRWNELLSSICRHGLLEHQESYHSVHTHDSSREIPGCCAPVSVKPRDGPRIKPMNSGCFRSELHTTTVLDAPSYNM